MTDFCRAHASFRNFSNRLAASDRIAGLRAGIIGEGVMIPGLAGSNPLLYADYVASGRALRQIEDFVTEDVLPYYANSHTEASFCGSYMTRMRRSAREVIAELCGADNRYATIFTGSGATNGINRLVRLLNIEERVEQGEKPLVLIGPYEHHSNILPWRETGAQVIEIGEAERGGPDLSELSDVLAAASGRFIVGAFSAASNVTGIITDVGAVTQQLKRYGALAIWDFAGGGPYLPIDMGTGGQADIDAIVVSPHKFLGGPGSSGVLIVRKSVVTSRRPTFSGGGTVQFVSPWVHDFSDDVVAREEAGTPNVIGDIRAALCFQVKDAIGQDYLDRRQEELRQRAMAVWRTNDNLRILGNPKAEHKLPIFSFQVFDPRKGGLIHQQLFTRMLSDVYGIQARGGCACAGPYAHRLLGISEEQSEGIRQEILEGNEIEKPGWTRLNLSALMSDEKAEKVIAAVDELARNPYPHCETYQADISTARYMAEAM
ncbi:MAG: aminotransferase class V-fold PLP-dependent enzyme [Stappiaceae bacterium]